MSSDARTLPLRDAPAGARWERRLVDSLAIVTRAGAGERLAALCLLSLVAGSLLIVVMAADRPSILSPTTHVAFFPRWMAGPLGGLWPDLTRSTTALRYLFTG